MKIIKIVMITFGMILLLSQNIFASGIGEILDIGDSFIEAGESKQKYTMDSNTLKEGSSQIYNIFLVAGTVVAVLVGAFLGIQFMTAGIDKKVQVKESLFPYLISCVILFGSLGIWKLMITVLNQVK